MAVELGEFVAARLDTTVMGLRMLGVTNTGRTHNRGEGEEPDLAGLDIATKRHSILLELPYSNHSSYSEPKVVVSYSSLT